jgi:hypothetical protein
MELDFCIGHSFGILHGVALGHDLMDSHHHHTTYDQNDLYTTYFITRAHIIHLDSYHEHLAHSIFIPQHLRYVSHDWRFGHSCILVSIRFWLVLFVSMSHAAFHL